MLYSFPGDNSEAGSNAGGLISLGAIGLGLGSSGGTTYTTSGAKSLGGRDFTLAGVSASNTIKIDDVGIQALLGSGFVDVIFANADLWPTLDISRPYSVIAECDLGTSGSGSYLYVYQGTGVARVMAYRGNNTMVASAITSGTSETALTVANATDLSAICMDAAACGVTARYWIRGDTIDGPASGRMARAIGRNYDYPTTDDMVLGFGGTSSRSRRFTKVEAFQDPAELP